MKRVITVFLLLLLMSMLFADGVMPEGSGTEADPYLIANLDNLLYLSTVPTLWASGLYFLQTADIDASDTQNWNDGAGFSPIGFGDDGYEGYEFRGSYNGDNHTISELFINRPEEERIGLFGKIDWAEIRNLGLVEAFVAGEVRTGGLVGYNCYYSSITNSYSTGSVTGNCYSTGGLVGVNAGYITNSYSTGNITGNRFIGGLVGYNDYGHIFNCYSNGSVTGNDYTGGLVGYNNAGDITNCYCTGNVTGNDPTGGLLGVNAGYITNSYWNVETSGQTTSSGGEGRTTNEMTYPYAENTFVGWNFELVWLEDINYEHNNGYPYLRDNPPTVDIDDDELITQHSALIISNYPNPFKPSDAGRGPATTISYNLPNSGQTEISIYNIKGQLVKQLVNEYQECGEHTITWNGKDDSDSPVSSGIYFSKVSSVGKTQIHKMMMIK